MQSATTIEHGKITNLVMESLKNVLLENESTEIDNVNASTSLLGKHSILESLGLVTLLVDLEQRLEENYDVCVTLADERAMSQKNSPFRTVQSLIDYIRMLLEENLQSVGS